jgi:amidase
MPASKSAVVGIKPTVGLTSRYGVYSASEWQDSVGILARSVRDAAMLLTVIGGKILDRLMVIF